jgi:hypothetical protein
MAQVQNLIIEQGATFGTTLTVKDASGNPLDLTLYSARCFLKKNPASSIKFVVPAVVTTPKTDGSVSLALTPAQSGAIKAGRYLYVVEIFTNLDADVIRVMEGLVTVSPTLA